MPAVPETIPAPRFCRLVKLAATVAIDWLSNSTLLLASRKRTTSALLPAVAVVRRQLRPPSHFKRLQPDLSAELNPDLSPNLAHDVGCRGGLAHVAHPWPSRGPPAYSLHRDLNYPCSPQLRLQHCQLERPGVGRRVRDGVVGSGQRKRRHCPVPEVQQPAAN